MVGADFWKNFEKHPKNAFIVNKIYYVFQTIAFFLTLIVSNGIENIFIEKLRFFTSKYVSLKFLCHILDLEKIRKVYTELNVLNITPQGL